MRKTPYTKSDYISSASIKIYMIENISDHVDPLTGEVNATTLAEDACQYFDGYEGPDYDIPDKFSDISYVVSERYEIKSGVRNESLSSLRGLINSLPSDWF